MTRRNFFIVYCVLAAMLAVSATADAATITVTNGNDSGAGSLRQMIADAQAGDTILFQAGVTTVTLTTDQLVIDKNLTIDGGTGVTVQRSSAEGTPQFRIFYINSGIIVKIKYISITGGYTQDGASGTQEIPDGVNGSDGGGIYVNGSLTLEIAVVSDNQTGSGGYGYYYSEGGDGGKGGGIYVGTGGTLTLNDSVIKANTSGNGLKGYHGDGGNGGGIYVNDRASLTLNRSIVENNVAADGSSASDTSLALGSGGGGGIRIRLRV